MTEKTIQSSELQLHTRRLSFGTMTLAELRGAILAGTGETIMKPSDEFDVRLTDGRIATAVCAFMGEDMGRFVFKDCIGEGVMNDRPTNKGGYFGSKGRETVLTKLLPLLPEQLREIIVPRELVEIIDGKEKKYADPLWLPSATDLFGNMDGKWWPDEPDSFQLPAFTRDRDRVKELKEIGTYPYWLRSVIATYATAFCYVDTDGGANDSYAYYSIGFAPGFDIA